MSRARNIKPGFFKNEILVELPFEYRLLFIGLWTVADREGRMEDRPVKIKMEVFPADAVDVDAGLQALHENGFILRYVVDGKRFVQILAWNKHQNPHVKEARSTIPAPVEHHASPVQGTTKAVASPADSLIPDSLIPDSLQEQSLSSTAAPIDQAPDKSDLAERLAKVTDEAIAAYNASPLTKRNGGSLPNVSPTIGREKRQAQVRRCLRVARAICEESTGSPRVTAEFWTAYFELVALDDFYAGRVPGGPGHEGFVPDFETLTSEKTMLRLYDRQVAA